MKTRFTLAILAALAIALTQPSSAFGRSHELSILTGACAHGASVDTRSTTSVSAGANLSIQFDYALRFKQNETGTLYLEVPVAWTMKADVRIRQDSINASASHLFLTPGVRYQFAPASRFQPYVAAGFGFGWFDGANLVVSSSPSLSVIHGIKPATSFGGGAEIRIHRGFALRAEVRDYVALCDKSSGRNNVVFQAGFGFHF
ncbi:outer membrane beta-barrel protein [Paludibaculum fermentans]|uniref:outer membrane beta-barrel protein n=1 Tax=Paludibaculum fermentans TaxID=1473598 RepID=UPI003EB9DBB2